MYANSHSTACAHSADRTVVAEKPETLMGEPDLCMPPSPQARLAELAACYGNNFQAGVDGKMTLPNFNSRSRPSLHICCWPQLPISGNEPAFGRVAAEGGHQHGVTLLNRWPNA